ncbi:MAG: monovalent cation:proton antiporter-2 (CPA2) family protein [Chelatococcus sp.]|jgi:glutathione-regulated potassium-efflux system protein KefB|uniref:monovalent cation:proton antiporter-2 (CPA2) family protein n=1 Tax=unclassified Chelatococcus TaxID=2638111 RepID=UPI001BCD811F|nr:MULTISPECIES: monovalent cation:proton antiporter-2 (CPA2) family protein [unclassified Chelatococcus]CAH1649011.1 Glutathione-regulated potassium-efflux system protein [Hyphomicrobiales bacterium]MBS7739547.1 monovalent cation:proton antiporter-2 (CPA2) family protein [Chelatococcus sp. HY11]MBX3537124.1 monovalent cation:proton antiporter-2 (CPA2) family protein [Chelatococcus sp.]MBX3543916.1 monovalent cation:proton antiporter-2 (CPA2) family protein [Chelatococcus sp.]MCO5075916.1 mono
MNDSASHASYLLPVLVFCGAAVVAVPIFRRIGLGAVLGYLCAGVFIGPDGLALIGEPETVAGVAEIGVVLLLFIVGLELNLSRLFAMRRDIFGLGLTQLLMTGGVAMLALTAAGIPMRGSVVTGLALALSATAIALQTLEERGELHAAYGERSFAILLFQDLSIVPILALVPLLATTTALSAGGGSIVATLFEIARALIAVAAVVLIGRYLLNPFFRLLASSGAREVMTAAALLVVLGAAFIMEKVGLSMAMGAFLAGVLLAESNFRHQLEADIEPFRGVLLGLFFMSVGMSIDIDVVIAHVGLLALAVPALVLAKTLIGAVAGRIFGSTWRDSLRMGALLGPAGEFSFVIFPLAGSRGLLDGDQVQIVTAMAALTMLIGPIFAKIVDRALERTRPAEEAGATDLDALADATGKVIVIGFGRFGQVVNQILLAQRIDVTVIDHDVDRIREASRFGFRVYYGDGTRLDVLRASGAAQATVICVCVDSPETATTIVELLRAEFPGAAVYARAIDRAHAITLMQQEVDYQLRETFESALTLGRAALEELGYRREDAIAVQDDVRRRDVARLMLQKSEGFLGGADLLHHGLAAVVTPEPLTEPPTSSQGLSAETRDILAEGEAAR